MKMTDCPKFDRCSAPVCPREPEWQDRIHLKGERICFYMLEYVKAGAVVRFKGSVAKGIYHAIAQVIQPLSARYGPIRRALERSKQSGSRIKRPGSGEMSNAA